MTLYVQIYGLSFKRLLTYWGMGMLGVFFFVAALKVWKEDFSFFRVLFTVSIVGWLVLNGCNADRIVATYNVKLYQRQEIAVIDLNYMINELSYDVLDVLDGVIFETPDQDRHMESLIEARRKQAGGREFPLANVESFCLLGSQSIGYVKDGGTYDERR